MITARLFEKYLFYFILAIFIVGGLLRACFVDFSDFDYGIYSDHFINAVTAKNLSIGLGWSSSGYETYLLNPENLTIGPTIVLPIAASVAIFGNTLAIPGISVFVLNIFLLILLLCSLKKSFDDENQFYLCAFLLVFVFIFFKSYYWYRMIGEVSAILLLLLVITHLSQYLQNFNKQSLAMAAFSGTFAMGTKELVLLPILALTFVIICVSFFARAKNRGWQFWLGRPLLFLSTCLVLPALFFLYQCILLQTQAEAWRSAYFAYADSIHDYYSGINILREYFYAPNNVLNIFQRVLKSALWNGGTLLHLSFVGMRGFQYWLCIFAGLLACIVVLRKFTTLYTLLAVAALPLLFWYLCISEKAMPRHLYIGLCLAVLAVLFYVASIKKPILRYMFATLALFAIILTGDRASRFVLVSWPTHNSPNAVAALDIKNRIEQQSPKSISWMGMVDNNEFEYLSNTPNNFTNAFDQIADSVEFDQDSYLASHPHVKPLIASQQYNSAFDYYTSPSNKQRETIKVKLLKPIAFNWLHFKDDVAQFGRAGFSIKEGKLCKEIIYQNEYYLIEHCLTGDIQASLDKVGGLPVRPRKWRPYILLPSERMELF